MSRRYYITSYMYTFTIGESATLIHSQSLTRNHQLLFNDTFQGDGAVRLYIEDLLPLYAGPSFCRWKTNKYM